MHDDQLIAERYRLIERIGSGGMGVVWRATDEETGDPVALKRALVSDEAGDRKVRREARLAADVRHPNVVGFLGVAEDGGELWLVLEYVPSRNLSELLKRDGPLPVRTVNEVGAQVAGALEAVHGLGIVHRDVTPGNVLITEEGRAKLTDFGISRSVSTDETVTESPVVGGTLAYLAPEVAAGDEPTTASDVFSLGATLYAAVEGAAPFDGDNPYAMLGKAAAGEFRAPANAAELTPVLAALMRTKPEARPDAAAARKMLEACLDGKKVVVPRPYRRRRLVLTAAVLVVVAGVVAGLVFGLPRRAAQNAAVTTTPPASASNPAPVSAAVGTDPHTADPCGLTDPAPLARFGKPELDPDYGNFNRCDVLVHLAGDHLLDVKVELDPPPVAGTPPDGRQTRVGGFDVVQGAADDESCRRILQLPDYYQLSITATDHDKDGVDLCAAADTAVTSAANVLDTQGMPRRGVAIAATSLATVDGCGMLDPATLAKVSKLDPLTTQPDFGSWGCRWESPGSEQSVQVVFDRGPSPNAAQDGKRVKIAGHDAFVLADDYADNTCQVKMVYRDYTDAHGDPAAEVVEVVLFGQPPSSKLCTPATKLAGVVAAKLPPA
ncbi:serine/threonine-protein kinase [Amycolatopsis sp. H20-H5]|uniref:serine/threonine-protein kinase n=1 Tax=Amycolatopsis sp. H20-H5 TaxID=3046309 RepID=UPI002DBCEA73|nr:serine/threonine-protein kinase [Amycolatopsis sp. H20-H5]MEC3982264.1 serine/threonine-protein kinase [Amycolatopsis sp. H20-H5]